jgi:hypothetical protein
MFKKHLISTNEELTNMLMYCRVIDIAKQTFIFSVLAMLLSKYIPFTTHELFYVVIGLFILSTLVNILFHNESLKRYPKRGVIAKPFEASVWELYQIKAIDITDKP